MDLDNVNINDLSNTEIASRMRKCNYEKFKTLVRMHLSFELDLNTDEFDLPCHEIVYEEKGKLKKWSRLSKKQRHLSGSGCASNGKSSASAENSPTETLAHQIDPGFLFHLNELKSYLLLHKNITQEGIFRKTGSISRQNELRLQIQNEIPLHLENGDYSPHDCATVFKGYLAEMPEPLLTDAHYPAHLQIAPLCVSLPKLSMLNSGSLKPELAKREYHILHSVQLILLLLPEDNRQLMHHVIDILHNVAKHESFNKMSAENLATLFAPHLICPRNIPPEALHYLSQKMSGIIAYMVNKGDSIFDVPAKLATDIRAYFLERKRKKTMSPEQTLDDSISDISTVNTVYTFVDREKTAAAHTTNTTDTELAQLYAHIQSLPESSKKRRLIKQFNKQNGQGTPLQLVVMNRLKNSEASRGAKSISDSIKKHIFHRSLISKTPKRANGPIAVGVETPNFSNVKNPKLRVLFQSPVTEPSRNRIIDMSASSSSSIVTPQAASNIHKSIKSHQLQKSLSSFTLNSPQIQINHCVDVEPLSTSSSDVHVPHVKSRGSISAPVSRQSSSELAEFANAENDMQKSADILTVNVNTFETPMKRLNSELVHQIPTFSTDKKIVAWDNDHLVNIEEISDSGSSSSEQKSNDMKSRYKSEPNLSRILKEKVDNGDLGSSETHALAKGGKSLTRKLMKGVSMSNIKLPFTTPESTKRLVRSVSSSLKRHTSEDAHTGRHAEGNAFYSENLSIVPLLENIDDEDLDDETFEDSPDDQLDSYSSAENQELAEETSNSSSCSHEPTPSNNNSRQYLLLPNTNVYRNLDLITSTPSLLLGRRRSMSPITKSTQRMPKSMQESIMTPRSRKPVMDITLALSASDQNQTVCQTDLSSFREQDEEESFDSDERKDNATPTNRKNSSDERQCAKKLIKYDAQLNEESTETDKCFEEEDPLSVNFKAYLRSRSVLTASPVDSSFSSQSDDFNSTQDIEQFNNSQLSKSLLYCLDGNEPNETVHGADTSQQTTSFGRTNCFEQADGNYNNGISVNNARKRAASHDLENASKSNLTETVADIDNKENHENLNSYLLTKKLLINEHPGETSF